LEKRQINQVASFTYLEYPDNVDISDDEPKAYFETIRKEQFRGKEEVLSAIRQDHCLPEKFYAMDYEEFLRARRRLMSKAVRETFESLKRPSLLPPIRKTSALGDVTRAVIVNTSIPHKFAGTIFPTVTE
jgi:hypothetical protein